MPARGRSPLRFARSRPPGWVTALGLLLALGELAAGIALLALGYPHVARSRLHGTSGGPARTVVFRVDGGYTGCDPVSRCGDEALQYQVLYVTPAGHDEWSYPRSIPFTKTVQVPAGEFVKFNAYAGGQAWATCTMTVDGMILSQITTRTLGGIAACQSVVPPNGTGSSAGTRTVVLEVENALSGDTATYGTPTADGYFDESTGMPSPDTRGYWDKPYRFTKTVEVRPGGIVTVRTRTGYIGSFAPSCSITVNGRVLSQVIAGATWRNGTCRAVIP